MPNIGLLLPHLFSPVNVTTLFGDCPNVIEFFENTGGINNYKLITNQLDLVDEPDVCVKNENRLAQLLPDNRVYPGAGAH